MLHSLDMPSFGAEDTDHDTFVSGGGSPYNSQTRKSVEKKAQGRMVNGNTVLPNGIASKVPDSDAQAGTNGRLIEATKPVDKGNILSKGNESALAVRSNGVRKAASTNSSLKSPEELAADDGFFASVLNGKSEDSCRTTHVTLDSSLGTDGVLESKISKPQTSTTPPVEASAPAGQSSIGGSTLHVPSSTHRVSSPPAFPTSTSPLPGSASTSTTIPHPSGHRLQQRHTLEVPKSSLSSRVSREYPAPNASEEVISATGRFSPNTPTRRRGSMSLIRRTTRSIHSDLHLDDGPQDEEAMRWAEKIKEKRASKRKREEDDDRVVVGTKVDQNHVNWVTAYNMLTGIRFTVSRTNAKMDRELTDADFDAKHKFSFDITGNELTPSAKYDFKFKDYAPWVFRHLRSIFRLDPADYLMSLTSKYILSELGSPGKSGSFFYFSRDYKYIIKTIHHAEHKFLRKILRDYYNHVQENPNTLLSQFYGLHRVKIPYGRKIHFVVMNNLFPPHKDIHRTFDLKGSTIGRDFREEDLEKNPRATLKDLNWLRRNLHLEFGPTKKRMFIEQMERDVKLLRELKIMDYSLLVGIHDLERGNEDNLRDKQLKVFQPGGENGEDPAQTNMLLRTPSKLENERKKKELRQQLSKQKPVPMDQSTNKMPEEIEQDRKAFYFYSDDGGFRATHEDDRPGEEIYYLGIIDCLTHYSLIKRAEHFFKGITNTESQISAIPPERYGDRFVRFISGVTKTRERAEMEKAEQQNNDHIDDPRLSGINMHRTPTDKVMERAEKQAEKSKRRGASEDDVPDRQILAVRSPSTERGELGSTLPVVEEAVESQSTGGRSGRSGISQDGMNHHENSTPQPQRPPPTPPKDASDYRPATPPKDATYLSTDRRGPPTPPKEDRGRGRDKELPPPPNVTDGYTRSPSRVKTVEMEELGMRVQSLNT